MEKLVLNQDLEVQNLSDISDEQLVKDINFIQDFQKDFKKSGFMCIYGGMGDMVTKKDILDQTFVNVYHKLESYDIAIFFKDCLQKELEDAHLSGRRINFNIERREKEIADSKASFESRKDDFFLLWFSESIYTSAQLQEAMRHPILTIGNIENQWKSQMKDRIRSRVDTQ